MKTIGIIGAKGRFGAWLERFFKERGDRVIGSDIGTTLKNSEVVTGSDVVIFSVPIREMSCVIKEAVPFSCQEQLWIDVTSIKSGPIQEMMLSNAEVVGLHPLFAPPKGLTCEGKTIVACKERLSVWEPWVDAFLVNTKASIRYLEPKNHDSIMLVEQNLVHLTLLVMASVTRQMNTPTDCLVGLSTPLSRLFFAGMHRILLQDPNLYADIQFCNGGSSELLKACRENFLRISGIIERKDHEAFRSEFLANREYFGDSLEGLEGFFV